MGGVRGTVPCRHGQHSRVLASPHAGIADPEGRRGRRVRSPCSEAAGAGRLLIGKKALGNRQLGDLPCCLLPWVRTQYGSAFLRGTTPVTPLSPRQWGEGGAKHRVRGLLQQLCVALFTTDYVATTASKAPSSAPPGHLLPASVEKGERGRRACVGAKVSSVRAALGPDYSLGSRLNGCFLPSTAFNSPLSPRQWGEGGAKHRVRGLLQQLCVALFTTDYVATTASKAPYPPLRGTFSPQAWRREKGGGAHARELKGPDPTAYCLSLHRQ